MMKAIRITVLVVGFTALSALGLARLWPQVPLDSALTSPAAPPTRLVCYGYVDSQHGAVMLQPTRPGRVVRVLVNENQTVSKDAPLIQLDDDLVKLQEQEAALAVEAAQVQLTKAQDGVKQYQAKRAQAEAAVEAARARSKALEHSLALEQGFFDQGVSNKNRVGAARSQLHAANFLVEVEQNKITELQAADPELEVKQARIQLNRSQSQLERARRERAEYVLHAPVSGLVLRIQAQEGDLLGPTSQRPAVWLSPEGAWIVRAEVSQEFAGLVKEGLEVRIEDEANAQVLGAGTIAGLSDWFMPRRQLSLLPTGVNTGLTMDCVVELKKRQAPLRLGQHVRVRVLADQPAGGSATMEVKP